MVRRLIEAPDLKKKRETTEIPEEKRRNISDLSSIISDIVSARAELDNFNKDFGSVSQLQSKINQFNKTMAEVVSKLGQTDNSFGAFASEITKLQRELKAIQGKFDKVAKEVTKKEPEPTRDNIDEILKESLSLVHKRIDEVIGLIPPATEITPATDDKGIKIADFAAMKKYVDKRVSTAMIMTDTGMLEKRISDVEASGSGSGDMTKAVYDAASKAAQLATEAELAAHAGTADVHHAKYLDSQAASAAWTNLALHSGTADVHHAKYTNAEAVAAIEAAGITFAENKTLALDAALSADGRYSGVAEAGEASTAIAFGELAYLAAAATTWALTLASTATTSKGKLGMCVQAATADGDGINLLLFGKIRADTQFPALTVGAPVFASAATAGRIVTSPATALGNIVRIVGYGNTGDELFFNPDKTYLEM